MFSRQAPQIHNALLQGGLAPAMASQFQNLLGQCQAGLVHRGPITVDRSSPSMRLIDPTTARLKYPELLQLPSPPGRSPGEEEQEEELPEDIEDNPVDPSPPPFEPPAGLPPPFIPLPPSLPPPPKPYKPKAGDYIEIRNGDAIYLKHKDQNRHCTFQGGFVKGVEFDTYDVSGKLPGDQQQGKHISIEVKEGGDTTTFEYGIQNLTRLRVVTKVELQPAGARGTEAAIKITKKSILCWLSDDEDEYEEIPLVECKKDDSGGGGSIGGGSNGNPRETPYLFIDDDFNAQPSPV